jgi:spermidine synthase
VRLVEVEPAISDFDANALVIGLGIGTAPKALIAHGINTTVVELDPKVHDFATRYFDLPSTHTAVLHDAVSWVATASTRSASKYDYIIHDVFTGGAEPLALFTDGFLAHLRSLLTPNGVIALNYAGDLHLPLTLRILNTILRAFDGQCKVFRDSPASSSEINEDFLNMLVFCRNTAGPITFRKPNKEDFLGSKSRAHYLPPRKELELDVTTLLSGHVENQILRVGDEGKWRREQEESAIRHWHIMRKVLPAVVWESW